MSEDPDYYPAANDVAAGIKGVVNGTCARCGGALAPSRYEDELAHCVHCGSTVFRRAQPRRAIPEWLKGHRSRGGRPRKRRCGYDVSCVDDWRCMCGISFPTRRALGAHVNESRAGRLGA